MILYIKLFITNIMITANIIIIKETKIFFLIVLLLFLKYIIIPINNAKGITKNFDIFHIILIGLVGLSIPYKETGGGPYKSCIAEISIANILFGNDIIAIPTDIINFFILDIIFIFYNTSFTK